VTLVRGERVVRRRHRLGRLADLRYDGRVEVRVVRLRDLSQPSGDEAADPLRREVLVRDDPPALQLDESHRGLGQRGELRVAEQDESLLGRVELRGVHADLGRLWEALDTVFAVNAS
jgi:hypothetical protein